MSTAKEPSARHDWADLFEPRSIAIIGASDKPGNLGGRVVRFLRKFNFPGPIWPVNPGGSTVGDLPCFRSVTDLPEPAALAIFAVSAARIPAAIEACAAAGMLTGIAWAAGFAEVGGDGVALQQELVDVCKRTGFTLCGPNSLGVINTWLPMPGTFASSLVSADRLIPGNISMVSQSGGIGMATFSLAQQAGIGFRYLVSAGNEAILTTADYLTMFAEDPETRVIAVYLEGLTNGPAFLRAMEKIYAAGKPVVMLKAGFSAASARAALAHTGALSGEDRVWQAILREQAVITVESNRELLDVAMYLSTVDTARLPQGNRVAIIGFGGGGGVLSADLCARRGLEIPALTASTRECLLNLVPAIASVANPIDLTPDMFQPEFLQKFPAAMDAIAADPNVDMLLFPLSAMARGATEVARDLVQLASRTRKPVFISWVLAPSDGLAVLRENGTYAFPEPSSAIGVMGKLAQRNAIPIRTPCTLTTPPPFDWNSFVPTVVPGTATVVSEDACHRLLHAAGLSVAAGRLATSPSEALTIANTVGFPVAMKGISAEVTHRADAGLLSLNLRDEHEVTAAYDQLSQRAAADNVPLDGLYIQHMVKGRLELLVSAFRDPIFGVMVVCGAGGNFAELIDDITLERAPFDNARAQLVLQRLRIIQRASHIDPTAQIGAAADFLSRFSQLAATAPWSKFVLEVNPIKWQGANVTAVDGLLIVEEP